MSSNLCCRIAINILKTTETVNVKLSEYYANFPFKIDITVL